MRKVCSRILSVVMIMCVLFSLVACGGGEKSQAPASQAPASQAPASQAPESQTPEAPEEIDYPTKPITVVVGYGAGGGTDMIVRKLCEVMSKDLGQPINILNVSGGSGSVAGIQVNASPSDGYTILAGPGNVAAPWRTNDYCDLGWEDWFSLLGAAASHAILVPKDSPFQTLEDFVAYGQAHPGELKWGHSGYGSLNQTTCDMMLQMIGVEATSIPYGGGAEVATKLLAGEIDFTWLAFNEAPDFIASGDLRAIAIMKSEDLTVETVNGSYVVPSLSAAYPETAILDGVTCWGIHIKRDTDPAIVAKLTKSFIKATEDPEYIAYLEEMNVAPVTRYGQVSDELCAFLESFVSWGLADMDMAAEGISPADFDIPRPEDLQFPANERAENRIPWPEI